MHQTLVHPLASHTWIFQATPTDFEIDEFVSTKPDSCLWRVSRYVSEISVGDKVFLWRAKGKEWIRAGIFGRAEVKKPPRAQQPDRAQRDFWKKVGDRHAVEHRALIGDIVLLEARNLIPRDWLQNPVDQSISDLSILSQAQGTNFRVTHVQAERLDALWSRVGQPWSRDELAVVLLAYKSPFENWVNG